MRKLPFVLLIVLLLSGQVSAVSVLFDHTKSEDAGNADWVIDGAYSDWADDLRSLGYTVEELSPGENITYGDPNNPKDLSHYAVFILPEPQNPFSSSERQAILEFIQNGGTLIYIADHKSSDRDNDGWDSWSIWNDNLDFDSVFGIALPSTQIPSDTVIDDIENIPNLTDGISQFGIWLGTAITVSGNATAVAWYDRSNGLAAWAYATYGNGKVIVFADSSTFSDGSCKTSCKGYDDYHQYDDKQVALNMVKFGAPIGSSGGGNGSNNSSTGSPLLVINEIMYNPSGSDTPAEWVEIYNPNNHEVDLSGWWVGDDEGGGYKFPSGTIIPANGYIVVARNTTWVITHYSSDSSFDGSAVYGNATFQLSNTADDVILKDSSGKEIDHVHYVDDWGADGNGKSLERKDPLGDSNSSSNWAESGKNGGTPTYENTVLVPFFGALWAVAILLLLVTGRVR
ncbi:DUF4350 domain-containing protein [Thermococcus sp.]